MFRMLVLIAFLAVPAISAAQQAPLGNGTIDTQKLQQEYKEMSQMLVKGEFQAGLIKKREYCLTCGSGARLGCSSPIGGEAGKVWCSGQCIFKCDGSCGIAYGGC